MYIDSHLILLLSLLLHLSFTILDTCTLTQTKKNSANDGMGNQSRSFSKLSSLINAWLDDIHVVDVKRPIQVSTLPSILTIPPIPCISNILRKSGSSKLASCIQPTSWSSTSLLASELISWLLVVGFDGSQRSNDSEEGGPAGGWPAWIEWDATMIQALLAADMVNEHQIMALSVPERSDISDVANDEFVSKECTSFDLMKMTSMPRDEVQPKWWCAALAIPLLLLLLLWMLWLEFHEDAGGCDGIWKRMWKWGGSF